MSNPREEILKLASERLQNKVESIMLGVNILLSNPEKSNNVVDDIVKMMDDLAITESALNHARNLYTQCVALKLKEMSEALENKPKTTE
jgi:hypothetical protein